jgi:hypothetical protein
MRLLIVLFSPIILLFIILLSPCMIYRRCRNGRGPCLQLPSCDCSCDCEFRTLPARLCWLCTTLPLLGITTLLLFVIWLALMPVWLVGWCLTKHSPRHFLDWILTPVSFCCFILYQMDDD